MTVNWLPALNMNCPPLHQEWNPSTSVTIQTFLICQIYPQGLFGIVPVVVQVWSS